MARPKIGDALKRSKNISKTAQKPDPNPVTPAVPDKPVRAPSRVGKVNISAYFPPEVKSSLRLVQAKRGGNVTELLAEALNMLFAKYGVPESAPTEKE